jgi:hypothetical protein
MSVAGGPTKEPGWCPRVERQHALERTRGEREREARRITFGVYATEYLEWAKPLCAASSIPPTKAAGTNSTRIQPGPAQIQAGVS